MMILASALAIKIVLTSLITVRCRIVSGQFRPIKEDGENAAVGFLINYVFKALLFVCPLGPGPAPGAHVVEGGGEDAVLSAWLGIHRNATEQEPWFMALAFCFSLLGLDQDCVWMRVAVAFVYTYLASRVLH